MLYIYIYIYIYTVYIYYYPSNQQPINNSECTNNIIKTSEVTVVTPMTPNYHGRHASTTYIFLRNSKNLVHHSPSLCLITLVDHPHSLDSNQSPSSAAPVAQSPITYQIPVIILSFVISYFNQTQIFPNKE